MTFTEKYRTVELTQAELAALPRYDGQPGDGYFRSTSTADGSPMVMCYSDHPLGMREVWYFVEVEDGQLELPIELPRAFNSCGKCGRNFPGARGASDYVEHLCSIAA